MRALNGSYGSFKQKAFPVGLIFPKLRNQARPAPAAGLIDVPGHVNGDDIAELSRSEYNRMRFDTPENFCAACRFARFFRFLSQLAESPSRRSSCGPSVFRHTRRARHALLLHHAAHAESRRLRLPRRPHLCAHTIRHCYGLHRCVVPHALADLRLTFGSSQVPDIRHRDQFKIQFLGMIEKCREEARTEAIGEAHHAHAHPVIRTGDARIARCR